MPPLKSQQALFYGSPLSEQREFSLPGLPLPHTRAPAVLVTSSEGNFEGEKFSMEQPGPRMYGISTKSTPNLRVQTIQHSHSQHSVSSNLSLINMYTDDYVPPKPAPPPDPKRYDRYGFKKTSSMPEPKFEEWWSQYKTYSDRRRVKWEHFLLKSGLTVPPMRFPPRSDKLKRYVRKGIPAEWRGDAWWYFAKGAEILQPGKFSELVHQAAQPKDVDSIERDLHRTFPDNMKFDDKIESLRKVLRAFAVYTPRIGYCQSLNFIAGLLLLFLDEERAFWMLVIITSRYLPGVHDVNLEGVNVDQGVLMLCAKEYIPDLWNKIKLPDSSLPPVTLCTASWFMGCFVGTLPVETTLRVWDCMFYEGCQVLFQVALGVLKLAEPHITGDVGEIEIFSAVQNMPKNLTPQEVYDCVFKKRFAEKLTLDEVTRCRKFVREQRKTGAPAIEVTEYHGFKKGTAVHWNNALRDRMRQMKRKPSYNT